MGNGSGGISARIAVPDRQAHGGAGHLQQHGTARVYHEAAPIEHQLIVAAHLVHVRHRAMEPGGRRLGQPPAQRRFALHERGGREVEQQVGLQRHQGGDRVHPAQPMPPQNEDDAADGSCQKEQRNPPKRLPNL